MWDDVSCSRLIKEYWKIEKRHKKLAAIDPFFEQTMPINQLIDLEMKDGLVWEWKWKGPADELEFLVNPIQSVELGIGDLP